jgi:uncharacterized SAM-binding protein YcdF (DUF218 family)
MVTLLKLLGPPGSPGFLVACLGVGLALAVARVRRRYLWAWLGAVVALHVALSLPVVAAQAIAALPAYPPVRQTLNDQIDVLVVLSGDNPLGRARETAHIVREMSGGHVLALGPDWFVRHLVAAGVPEARIQRVEGGATTREQMAYLKQLVDRDPDRRFAVVASVLQMPRVAALAEHSGIDVHLRPSPTDAEPASGGLQAWLPQPHVSRVFGDAVYELAALAYYRHRGWITGWP